MGSCQQPAEHHFAGTVSARYFRALFGSDQGTHGDAALH
jgi:hypothetical protein